jgi:hypothetical protein
MRTLRFRRVVETNCRVPSILAHEEGIFTVGRARSMLLMPRAGRFLAPCDGGGVVSSIFLRRTPPPDTTCDLTSSSSYAPYTL